MSTSSLRVQHRRSIHHNRPPYAVEIPTRRCYHHNLPRVSPLHSWCEPSVSSTSAITVSHWPIIHQQLHHPLSTLTNSDDESTHDDEHSLHANVHYILSKKVPIGRMNNNNLQKARSFLSIVSKWDNEKGARLSEALLERIYDEYSRGGNHNAMVDTEMYNICLNAWNRSGVDGGTIVRRVEGIVSRMEERYDNGDDEYSYLARPDRFSYNCLINTYSKWDEDSADKVEAVLEKMNRLAVEAALSEASLEREYVVLIRPDSITYNSLMNYYATRKNQPFSAQHAEDTLLKMSDLSQQLGSGIQMDATSFNIVLKAWSNSGGGMAGAQRAEAVLRMMMKLYNQGHESVQPTTVSFSTVINAFSKVAKEDAHAAVEKAMGLLDVLEGISIPDPENINSCYNAAANVIVKTGVKNAGDKVIELMERMKNVDAAPDERMYVSCIEAYAREGEETSFKRAKALITEMVEDPQLKTDSVVFNVLLDALTKDNSEKSLMKAQDIMTMMEHIGGDSRPDLTSYSIMISALNRSSSKDGERKAVDYLRSMLRSYTTDRYDKAMPNSFVFNCTLSMLARCKEDWVDDVIYKTLMSMESQQKRGNTTVIPDTITYNIVIGKLAKMSTKDNAKKVMKLLTSMEEREKDGNVDVAPDIITYTNVMKVQEKLDPRRAASIASSFLERAISNNIRVPMDRVGFRSLLIALSRSDKFEHAVTARKAWEWIERSSKRKNELLDADMCNLILIAFSRTNSAEAVNEVLSFLSCRIKRFKDGDQTTILPSILGFSAALSTLSTANRMSDALGLLDVLNVLSKGDKPQLRPDKGCYTAILAPLSRKHSNNDSNAIQAQTVLNLMRGEFDKIPTEVINAAINACAWTSGNPIVQRRAIEISFGIFQQAREAESVDAVTFGLMIKTCMRLASDDETRFKLVAVRVVCNDTHVFVALLLIVCICA